MRRWIAAAALTLSAAAFPLQGQATPANPFPHGGASLRVSVLTIGPGSAVFERFGHNALRIQDALTGMDLAYNWGMFSFEDPNFLGRFLSGDTRYWVEAFPSTWLIEVYIQQDRSVTEQVLNLTEDQRTRLAAFVTETARPENKFYRYDYFRDNCSTRVRDALDLVLGGSLQTRFSVATTEWTYRSEAVRLTTPDGLAQAGIDLALGPRADKPMTAWESMYVPMRLRDHLRDVTVTGLDGRTYPLVAEETPLFTAKRPPEPTERRGLTLGAWGPLLGIWMLLLAPTVAARRQRLRIPAAVMASVWYGVTGLLGLIILLMWIGSAHVFWYNNLNLLLVTPLGLMAMVPVARAILRGAPSTLASRLVIATVVQALLALLVGFTGVQRLWGPLLLLLPAQLGLAVVYWRHTREGAVPVVVTAPAAGPA